MRRIPKVHSAIGLPLGQALAGTRESDGFLISCCGHFAMISHGIQQSHTTVRPEFAYYSKHGADFNQSWVESQKTLRFIGVSGNFQVRELTAAQQFSRSSGGAAKV